MDNKHFIWIVPMILVIGFGIGFISGIKIPKEVGFYIDNSTQQTLRYMSDNMNSCNVTSMSISCACDLNKSIDALDNYHVKRLDCWDRYCHNENRLCNPVPVSDGFCTKIFNNLMYQDI